MKQDQSEHYSLLVRAHLPQEIFDYFEIDLSYPEGRLVRHNLSHRGFTSKGQPWELVYTEFFDLKSDATAREKQLKGWKNRDRLMSLIGRK